MATATGLDAGPAETGGGTACAGSTRWVAVFLALAAGWGVLIGYSAMVLTEDVPFRPSNKAALPDTPAFGFPPTPAPIPMPISVPIPVPIPMPMPSLAQGPEAPAPEAKPQPVAAVVPAPAAAPPPGAAAPPPAAPAPAPRVERAEYVGTWGPNEAACGARSRRRGYIPATITPERASAGRTICSFHDGRRSGNAWIMAADCSDRGRRWSSQVRLVVDGDRLTWTSGKGSASYIRCGRRAG